MEDALAAIAALVLWRLVVAVGAATILAVFIASVSPAPSPTLVVGIVIAGVAAGIVWQTKAEPPSTSLQGEPSISWPVALLGLSFVGLVWGGLLESGTKSRFIAFALLVATPFLFSPAVIAVTRRALAARQLVFGSLALSSGYAALYVIQSIVSRPGA